MDPVKVGIPPPLDAQRDAIHVAIAPVRAGAELRPGEHVGLMADGTASWGSKPQIGIVDPFLGEDAHVSRGEWFWLFLYPQTVTSLRHEWTHPAFSAPTAKYQDTDPVEVASAKAEIERIAKAMGSDGAPLDYPKAIEYYGPNRPMTYHRLMAAAEEFLVSGDLHVQMGSERWRDDFPHERFWKLYEVATGHTVATEKAENFFGCSC